MGVSKAPPRLSSLPSVEVAGVFAGFPQETESRSTVFVLLDEEGGCPFERMVRDEGSGIAGGRGKTCAPDVTWTTRSRACRYEGRVR